MKSPPLRLPSLLAFAGLMLSPLATAFGQIGNGLLNYWNFEGNYNDTAASLPSNASTATDNGTPQLGTTIAAGGPLGQYGQFIRSYVEVPNSTDILMAGRSLSISAWFRVDAFNQNWQALIGHGEGTDYRVARRGAESTLGYAGGVGDIPAANVGPAVNDTQWHHVVSITETGVSTRLWIDGNLIATGGVATLTNNGAPRLMIGGNPNGNAGDAAPTQYRPWNGGIDDVAMWSRPITPTEIGQIYNGGRAGKSLATLLSGDADGDGLPDAWEDLHMLDKNDNGSINPDNGAMGNPDMDGVTNIDEFRNGTNPRKADTDDDFSNDGHERTRGTNPLNPDSDGDGLLDGHETGGGTFVSATNTGSNPLNPHSDTDGVNDGVEVVVYMTDPNNAASAPPPSALPIIDDFEDGVFNTVHWMKNLVGIPQAGAAVTEQGGRLTLESRGHLVTVGQFDPELTNGLRVSGEWTFVTMNGGDFIQVLTRSDGTPGGANGETVSGIEFFASAIDNSATIRARNAAEHVISGVAVTGGITFVQGGTYDFTAIDSGTGALSFRIVDKANPLNAVRVTATLDADTSPSNRVAVHNREAGRTSRLEILRIEGNPDSDNDGMDDAWEMANLLVVGSDDSGGNPDSDDSTNIQEFRRLTNPQVGDTDADGALDGHETNTGMFASLTDRGTNPLKPDTDRDGLLDGVEDNTGIFVDAMRTGTNPNIADSDMDGMNDGTELSVGRNPNSASDGAIGLARGLVSYWDFDNNLDDIAHTVLRTDSTVADTGMFTGPGTDVGYAPAGTGRFGTSSLFQNGAAGWVTVPGSNDTRRASTNSVSISAWFKVNAFDTAWQALISHGEGTQYRIARNGTDAANNMAYAGGAADITGGGAMNNNNWHHLVAITTNGVGTAMYIDGVLAASGTALPAINDNGNSTPVMPNLFIGANPQGGGREWNGWIDDVGLWSRPLTTDEIASIWAGGIGASIGDLTAPPGPFYITNFAYNSGTDEYSITWTSKASKTYGIFYSTDFINWGADVNDSIAGAAGQATTTYTFPKSFLPNVPDLFFRVRQN